MPAAYWPADAASALPRPAPPEARAERSETIGGHGAPQRLAHSRLRRSLRRTGHGGDSGRKIARLAVDLGLGASRKPCLRALLTSLPAHQLAGPAHHQTRGGPADLDGPPGSNSANCATSKRSVRPGAARSTSPRRWPSSTVTSDAASASQPHSVTATRHGSRPGSRDAAVSRSPRTLSFCTPTPWSAPRKQEGHPPTQPAHSSAHRRRARA